MKKQFLQQEKSCLWNDHFPKHTVETEKILMPLKNTIAMFALILGCSYFSPAQAQTWLWASSNTAGNGEGYDIAADDSGNVYLVGEFITAFLSFGTNTISNSQSGNGDIYLAKFDPAGNPLWVRHALGLGYDQAFDVTVDASGNPYITGVFNSDTLIFDNDTLFNAGFNSYFLTKYDPNGNVIWTRGAAGTGGQKGSTVYADPASGAIVVTGDFSNSSITFGSYTLNCSGNSDIFLVKYDVSGNVLWATRGGGTGMETGNGVATDNAGNIFLTGYISSDTASFGNVTLYNQYPNTFDVYLVKYDANGNAIWGNNEGGHLDAVGFEVAADPSGNSFITGYYDSTITFGTYTLNTVSTTASEESFIVKYDPAGNVVWAKSSEAQTNNNYVSGYGLATDISGNLYATGGFMNVPVLVFDQDTLRPTPVVDPMYILKIDPSGNILCATALSSGGDDNNAIVEKKGNVYIGGDYISNMIVGQDTLLNNNSEKLFVAKYQCDLTAIIEQQQVGKTIIYPNPSSGIFTLDLGEMNFTNGEITIVDVLGNIIYQSKINSPQTQLDLTNNSTGIYFYKISNTTTILSSGKIILK